MSDHLIDSTIMIDAANQHPRALHYVKKCLSQVRRSLTHRLPLKCSREPVIRANGPVC